MKTLQTFLLFILLIAVGPYPQHVSAIYIKPADARTDTIKLGGLTTVTPNEETQNEEKFAARPLVLQNTVTILQQSPESGTTLNSSPNESVQPTSNAPNTTSNLETKTEKIYETVTAELESIVSASVSTDTESKRTTSVLESKSYTETTPHELVSLIASIEATQVIFEQNNTTGHTESSSTSEGSSKLPIPAVSSSVQSLPSSIASKSTNGVQQSRSFETVSSFYEFSSESTEGTQTPSDENTSGIPPESSLASKIASESPLLTSPSSAEPIPASTETTQIPSNSDNNPSIPPESNPVTDISSQSSLSTAQNDSESILSSKEAETESTLGLTQLSEGSTAVKSTLWHSNCVTSSVLDLGTQNSVTQKSYDKITENRPTSTSQTIESGLGDAGNTAETVATTESEVDSNPSVYEQDTQSRTESEADPGSSKTAESQNKAELEGGLVAKLPTAHVSAAVDMNTETPDDVTISNANTPDGAENPETSTGPAEAASHIPEDSPIPSEDTATPNTAPESEPATSLPTNPSTSKSIPEATQTLADFKNTSSTPPESESTSKSASELPLPSAIPERIGPSSKALAPSPCNETGNFPDPVNCRTYIACSGNVTDLLRQEIVCPDRSAFSPILRRCARDISPCNDEPPCLFSGSIADPTTTSAYYWCAPSLLGGFHKYHIHCSFDEAFNALFGRCLLKTPTYGLIKPSLGIPNDRDIAKAESKQMKKEIKAKAKEEKHHLKNAAKAKADAEKLALKQQKKQKDEEDSDA